MHRFIRATYRLALRVQGSYMMLLVGLALFTMPIFALNGVFLRSLVVILIGLGVALVLCKPHWQPGFLRAPSGFLSGFGSMCAASAVFIVALVLGFMAVINMNLAEPLSRNVAILTALPSLLVTGVMWWAALFVSILPSDGGTPPHVTPKHPTAPRASRRPQAPLA
ncbi:hypothetical protein [uncultured Tateyamaria sp.]|uniref:hypothetical protein n=1 Tax=uncultured Tateyamaria sp. TaxID=455651 RepID=UPI0026254634|nr:hypothetical protein [uncultured Tateyamaria sp.]